LIAQFEKSSRFTQALGLRLHYHDVNPSASGLPLICLHGTGPGASAWSNFSHNIDAFAARFRTVLLDLPQYGRSDKPVITEGRQTYTARVLKAFLDELGIGQANFVGNSMGGQIALKLAIDHPESVNRLVLIGSSPTRTTLAPWPVEAIRLIRAYYEDGGPTEVKMRMLLETMVYDRSLITDEMVRSRYEASIEPDTMAVFTTAPPPQEDFGSQLESVKARTLLIWGQEDRAGALEVGLFMLKRLADAELHVFSKVGHWVQVERPEAFNRLVLEFLEA
jgi:4,5:9,10-diseco-3-hydroxy-5,9,17-trioxoandrosta-1(10),2-diene-4-oate hydrolase